jgi:ParB-like chromosome segregation protein Spo0J
MANAKPNKPKNKGRDKHQRDERKLEKRKKTEVKLKKEKKSKDGAQTTIAVKLPAPSYKVIWIPPHKIEVDIGNRCRPVMPDTVKTLIDGIAKDGLRTPLTIRFVDGVAHLVVGLQRLEALKALKWAEVPCVREDDEFAAQCWQIDENRARGELTKLQRAEVTAALLALRGGRQEISGEKVQKRKPGRPEGGDAEAARTLNLRGKTPDAKRKNLAFDRKVSGIHADAKQAMVDAGLDDDGEALREVANEPTRKNQLAKVKALVKAASKTDHRTSDDDADDAEPPLVVLKRAWKKAKDLQAAWRIAELDDRRAFIIEDLGYPLDGEPEADNDDEYDDDERDDADDEDRDDEEHNEDDEDQD